MYEDGYEEIVNIDISHTVVKYMEEKIKARCPKMVYKQMDVLDMSDFKQGEFNVVLDKGTLDSILCGDNSTPNAEKMLSEIHRVLAPNGIYICVTYGDEEHRKKFFVCLNLKYKTFNYKYV
jgi:ubiquinone/menaquinone biosynthesis C-methylase UbiE